MERTPRTPSLRHHKRSGQGVVELNGREVYLGKWGRPETQQKYHRVIAEWIANGRRPPQAQHEITVSELILEYWEHAKATYVTSEGKPSAHLACIKPALKTLRELYGDTPAADFGPKKLRTCQETWAAEKMALHTCNARLQFVKRLFKWASALEKVTPATWHGLLCVEGLRLGRSAAKAPKVVAPVSQEHIDKIRDHVAPPVWALVQLQLLCGARSGELLKLRPCDIDRSGDVWTAALKEHKAAWKGKARVLFFGPKAQAVLRPFLLRPSHAYLFDPREAVRWHAAQCKKHRRPGQKPNPRRSARVVGDCYRVDSYRRAIERACIAAEITPWFPHQLRHTAATRVREEFGLEGAQVVLGHSHARVTELYAEINAKRAADIARVLG